MFLKRIANYLNPLEMFKKSSDKEGFNLRAMHFINRIALYMFLIAIAIMLYKFL